MGDVFFLFSLTESAIWDNCVVSLCVLEQTNIRKSCLPSAMRGDENNPSKVDAIHKGHHHRSLDLDMAFMQGEWCLKLHDVLKVFHCHV